MFLCCQNWVAYPAVAVAERCSCNRHRRNRNDGVLLWLCQSVVVVVEAPWDILYHSIPVSYVQSRRQRWRNPWGSIFQDDGKWAVAVVAAADVSKEIR